MSPAAPAPDEDGPRSPRPGRTIRASEIGSYLFCQRAWWYQRSGHASSNLGEMAAGTELHRQHGQAVVGAGCLQTLAAGLLLAALALLVVYAAQMWLF